MKKTNNNTEELLKLKWTVLLDKSWKFLPAYMGIDMPSGNQKCLQGHWVHFGWKQLVIKEQKNVFFSVMLILCDKLNNVIRLIALFLFWALKVAT